MSWYLQSTGSFNIFRANIQIQRSNNMYDKEYYQAHKEERKASVKAWRDANREEVKAYSKAYYQENKDKIKERCKTYNQANKEYYRDYQREYQKEYKKFDLNSSGNRKASIRSKSQRYLNKYGTKIPGYQIHHCCTYTEPYKFVYCSKEMHRLIHAYLRQHNIDADSNHYEQIKHLLDDTVVKYGLE